MTQPSGLDVVSSVRPYVSLQSLFPFLSSLAASEEKKRKGDINARAYNDILDNNVLLTLWQQFDLD